MLDPVVQKNVKFLLNKQAKSYKNRKVEFELVQFKNQYWVHKIDNGHEELLKICYGREFDCKCFHVHQYLKEYCDWIKTGYWTNTGWSQSMLMDGLTLY